MDRTSRLIRLTFPGHAALWCSHSSEAVRTTSMSPRQVTSAGLDPGFASRKSAATLCRRCSGCDFFRRRDRLGVFEFFFDVLRLPNRAERRAAGHECAEHDVDVESIKTPPEKRGCEDRRADDAG